MVIGRVFSLTRYIFKEETHFYIEGIKKYIFNSKKKSILKYHPNTSEIKVFKNAFEYFYSYTLQHREAPDISNITIA